MEKSTYTLDRIQKDLNLVPESWTLYRLNMYKITDHIVEFIEKTIQTWIVELTVGGQNLAEVKIQRECTITNTICNRYFCHSTTSLENAQPDLNSIPRRKRSTS